MEGMGGRVVGEVGRDGEAGKESEVEVAGEGDAGNGGDMEMAE